MESKGIKTLREFMELAKKDSKKFNEGMFSGINAANETQFLYSSVQQSPILSSAIGKLVGGQFTTFPIKQTEFLLKGIRQSPAAFTYRYLMYTGMASAFAHYGVGLAVGRELGGLGSLPIAFDFIKEGKTDEAIYMGTTGLFKYLPDRFTIGRGMTPFNSLLLDTLALAANPDDPHVAWARWGRSMMSTVPAGLALRRAAEAGMAGFVEQGKRFEPGSAGVGRIGSALEGTSVVPALNKIFGSYFTPWVSDKYTGRLAQKESPSELLKAGFGLRSREAQMRSEIMSSQKGEIAELRTNRLVGADRIVQALEGGKPEQFVQAMQQALSSGAFVDEDDLLKAMQAAMLKRVIPKDIRQLKNAPRAFKMQELLR
jgi:hypothetical protein